MKVEAEKNSLLEMSDSEIVSLRAKKEGLCSKYESCSVELARINRENDVLANEITEKEGTLKTLKDDREVKSKRMTTFYDSAHRNRMIITYFVRNFSFIITRFEK